MGLRPSSVRPSVRSSVRPSVRPHLYLGNRLTDFDEILWGDSLGQYLQPFFSDFEFGPFGPFYGPFWAKIGTLATLKWNSSKTGP